jgi:hypothetical protein
MEEKNEVMLWQDENHHRLYEKNGLSVFSRRTGSFSAFPGKPFSGCVWQDAFTSITGNSRLSAHAPSIEQSLRPPAAFMMNLIFQFNNHRTLP